MPLALTLDAVQPLEKSHRRDTFDCGNAALNQYLQRQARQDAQRHVAAPFALLDEGLVVKGLYTLSASLMPLGELPTQASRKLPRYDHLPVTLLGRLAIDRSIAGQGAGAFLLADALRRSLQGAQTVGAMAVIVDAKDEKAEAFYTHFNFLPFQSTPLRLFLPMSQVAQLFS